MAPRYTKFSLTEVMRDKDLKLFHVFLNKKIAEMYPTPAKTARKWILVMMRGWTTPSQWKEMVTNNRKLEVVYRTWKNHFFGYSLETVPKEEELEKFREMVSHELRVMNKKAKDSRKKYDDVHRKKKKAVCDGRDFDDSNTPDAFSMENAKLLNARTARRNVVPRDMPFADSTNKRVRRVSDAPPVAFKPEPQQVISLLDEDEDEDSSEEDEGWNDCWNDIPDSYFNNLHSQV